MQSILDQGPIGSCVANAGFQALRMSQIAQGLERHELGARLMGYALARAYDGTSLDEDSGTHLRTFFWAVNKHGFCRESEYTHGYDTTKYALAPHPKDYRRAYDQRAPTRYWRIDAIGDARILAVQQAIAGGWPVCFGTDVSVEFTRQNRNDDLWFPPLNEPIAGGHAMVIVGYDGDVFTVANSWGVGVGVEGFHRFSGAYLKWARTRDLWVVEAAPPYSA